MLADFFVKMGKLVIKAFKKKEIIKISFEDTGTGIKEENKKNLFEPFFTTKPQEPDWGSHYPGTL